MRIIQRTLATIHNNLILASVAKFRYLVEMNGIKLVESSNDVTTVIQPKPEVKKLHEVI